MMMMRFFFNQSSLLRERCSSSSSSKTITLVLFEKRSALLFPAAAAANHQRDPRRKKKRGNASRARHRLLSLSLIWSFFFSDEFKEFFWMSSSGTFWDKFCETIEKFNCRQKTPLEETRDFWTIYSSFSSHLYILCFYDDDSDDAEDDDFFHRFGAKSDATGRPVRRFKKTNLVGEIPDV